MANLSNINNKFLVTTGGNVLIGQTSAVGSSIFHVSGEALFGNGTNGLLLSYSNGNSSGIIDTGHSSTALEFRVGNTQELLINGSSATFAGTVIGTIARFDTLNNSANSKNLIYRDSSGAKTVVGGGSTPDKIYILDGGNVGIGASLPGRGLTIDRSNQYAALEIIKNNTTNQIVYLGTGSSAGTDDPLLRMYHNGTENIRLYTTGDSWINGGNVGIGTSSPFNSAKLQVKTDTDRNVAIQTGTTHTTGIKINAFNDAANTNIPLELNGSLLSLKTGETEKMRIDSSGVTHIMGATASTNNSLQLQYNSTAGTAEIYSKSTGGNTSFEFYTSSSGTTTPKFNIGSSGDVKITTNGKFLQGVRNTGSATIDMIGFVGGTDTLQIKGGTSGAANAISFYDTGGFIGTWYDGKFGIGVTSPGAQLDVVGPSGGSAILKLQRNGVGAYQYFVTDIGSGSQQLFCDAQQADSGFVFRTRDSGNATIPALYIAPSGNIGIGNTSPDEKLEISGTGSVYPNIKFSFPGVTSRYMKIGMVSAIKYEFHANGSGTYMTFATEGAERMRITSGGQIYNSASVAATKNTFYGTNAGFSLTSGSSNTMFGSEAGASMASGSANTFVGSLAGQYTTGNYNTCIGSSAGSKPNMTGSNHTMLGYTAGDEITTGTNCIAIGFAAGSGSSPRQMTTNSNEIVIGSNAMVGAYIRIAWTTGSDKRDKINFSNVPHGLDFVNKLKPTSYNLRKERDSDEIIGKRKYGFLAQEILELEGENPVIIDNSDENKLALQDSNLIPILVNAIQELKAEIELLKSK
jgi:hypothetical protein